MKKAIEFELAVLANLTLRIYRINKKFMGFLIHEKVGRDNIEQECGFAIYSSPSQIVSVRGGYSTSLYVSCHENPPKMDFHDRLHRIV